MMTFGPDQMAHFLRSRNAGSKPALDVLRELEARHITGAATVRKRTPTALCESACTKQGKKLSELTAREVGWMLWPLPLYPNEVRAASGAERQAKYTRSGRQIACVIRDPAALDALAALERQHGGVTAAVSAALVATAPP